MGSQTWAKSAGRQVLVLLLVVTTCVIECKVRVVDNKGMKVFVLDEGAYSNLQYFLEELDVKRNQLYAAFPGSSPKSALRNENLVELEDRVPVVIGIPKRSASSVPSGAPAPSPSEQEMQAEAGDLMPDERQQQPPTLEKLVLSRKSDEWIKSQPGGQSYAGNYASSGHQQSNYGANGRNQNNYYSTIAADESPVAQEPVSYYDDRYSQSDYATDLRSESSTSVMQHKKPASSPSKPMIGRRWTRN